MPSLFRLVFVLAVLAGIVFAGMLALVYLVEPGQREISVTVPPEKLKGR